MPSKSMPIAHLNAINIIKNLFYSLFGVAKSIKACFSKCVKLMTVGDDSSRALSTGYIDYLLVMTKFDFHKGADLLKW